MRVGVDQFLDAHSVRYPIRPGCAQLARILFGSAPGPKNQAYSGVMIWKDSDTYESVIIVPQLRFYVIYRSAL